MKRWTPAVLALLCCAQSASASDDLPAAARELARRTAASVGNAPVAVSWRNISSTPPEAVAQARAAFESAVRVSNGSPAAEAQLTISENASLGLLVEEFSKGGERQVWMAPFRRAAVTTAPAVLEKRLLWEQEEQILDVAALPEGLLVLTPSAVVNTATKQRFRLPALKPWPRDVRGRLQVNGAAAQVQLPGMSCTGTVELALKCGPPDDVATLAPGRNYFVRKNAPPYYTAAPADSLWFLTLTDGTTGIFDAAFDRIGSVTGWGSDVASAGIRCGGAPVVFAARPGEGRDEVQAYAIVNRSPVAVGQPVEFAGPVTALWPGVAVVHETGKYRAYAISLVCAP
jgi:hypothetical protein